MRVRVASLEKTYRRGAYENVALCGVTLDVADGEPLALVGPSGCGKTTLLRVVAGLERPDAGTVFFDERDVAGVPPERRSVGFVFASHALYPHLSVLDNVAFGPQAQHVRSAESERRVRDALARMLVDEALWPSKPRELSSGQRQRVALARALAADPRLLLLDEPLANLDAQLRAELRLELAMLHRAGSLTTIFVTHDQGEALAFGKRIAVMRAGRIEQVGPGREIYQRPRNAFVASFVGTPAMSLLEGVLEGGTFRAAGGGLQLALGRSGAGAVTVGLRPDAVRLSPASPVRGIVSAVEDLGGAAYAYVDGTFGRLTVRCAPEDPLPAVGEVVGLALAAEQAHLFEARSGDRLPERIPA